MSEDDRNRKYSKNDHFIDIHTCWMSRDREFTLKASNRRCSSGEFRKCIDGLIYSNIIIIGAIAF